MTLPNMDLGSVSGKRCPSGYCSKSAGGDVGGGAGKALAFLGDMSATLGATLSLEKSGQVR
jgi:hypothetical protein